MFNISLAGFNIEIDNRYAFTERQCEKYKTNATASPDISVKIRDEALIREREMSLEAHGSEIKFSDGYIESICRYQAQYACILWRN